MTTFESRSPVVQHLHQPEDAAADDLARGDRRTEHEDICRVPVAIWSRTAR
jgi:hypothetical protein